MNFRTLNVVAGLALALSGQVAFAATNVDISWNGNSAKDGVRLNAFDGTDKVFGGLAHELSYSDVSTSSLESFLAFCIEPAQSNTKLVTSYEKSVFGGSQGNLLAALYTTSYKTGATWDATSQAAFQVAVWELTQQAAGANGVTVYDAGSGSFRVAGADSVVSLANTFLSNAVGFTGASTYTVYKLVNANYQDLVMATKLDVPTVPPLVVTQVPEPETYALLLAGLGIMGLKVRRRAPR